MSERKTTDEMVDDMLARGARIAHARHFDGVAAFIATCESPIERLFAAALVARGMSTPTSPDVWHRLESEASYRGFKLSGKEVTRPGANAPDSPWALTHWSAPSSFAVASQRSVTLDGKTFRVDFVAFQVRGQAVAVELDGHDFHEKTKDQAQRDKSRDRAFARAGWTVLRFTGSEVFAGAWRCVMEVMDVFLDMTERAKGGR